MSDTNSKTLQAYETHFEQWMANTGHDVSADVKKWVDEALAGLPRDAKILEIGSGFGRHAAYIQSKGYRVECTDATQAFVQLLQTNGFKVRSLNVLTNDLPQSQYDLVFANAVLLHFTPPETENVLRKILKSLKPEGRFAFSLARGEGQEWSAVKIDAPRFFQYWTKEPLEKLLSQTGWASWRIDDATSGHDNGEWLHVISYKG